MSYVIVLRIHKEEYNINYLIKNNLRINTTLKFRLFSNYNINLIFCELQPPNINLYSIQAKSQDFDQLT